MIRTAFLRTALHLVLGPALAAVTVPLPLAHDAMVPNANLKVEGILPQQTVLD